MGDDEVQPGGLARAGFAAEQHVAFGQVDVDVLAVLVDAQVHGVEHGEREPAVDGGGHGWLLSGSGRAGDRAGARSRCPRGDG